jgi:hypothetical protein
MARVSLMIVPGMRFGRLTAIEQTESSQNRIRWKCKCDCGNITNPLATHLRRGKSKSCGCLQKEIVSRRFTKDITGQRFGRLIALHPTGKKRHGCNMWRLRCSCGNEIERPNSSLGSHTQSCGCLQREQAAQRAYRHGDAKCHDRSPLHNCWRTIKQRCFNPTDANFKNYGDRGITMTKEWIDDYPAFRRYIDEDLGPRPKGYTLDRINNDGDYAPNNLRWASRSQQLYNTRRSRINRGLPPLPLRKRQIARIDEA